MNKLKEVVSKTTDLNSAKSENYEKSKYTSKEVKDEMVANNEKNKKLVEDAKAKLIIKIPKPFGMGCFTIDLTSLLNTKLGKLALSSLSSLALSLLLSKIAKAMGSKINDKLIDKQGSKIDTENFPNTSSIDESEILNALNDIDLNSLLSEVVSEENMLKLNALIIQGSGTTLSIMSDIDSTGKYTDNVVKIPTDTNVTDTYQNKNDINKPRIKEKYTINKRGRKDILDSDIVSARLGTNKIGKKVISNPNYGSYIE